MCALVVPCAATTARSFLSHGEPFRLQATVVTATVPPRNVTINVAALADVAAAPNYTASVMLPCGSDGTAARAVYCISLPPQTQDFMYYVVADVDGAVVTFPPTGSAQPHTVVVLPPPAHV